jgi:predicted AlkP superfamily pyrophosphatase or phosphodiesterase
VRRALLAAASALLLLACSSTPRPAAPTLLVALVVDQMRQDYIERYGGAWTDGLRRLVDRGAVFERASYPYLNTVTCTGHATIATGTFPYRHGVILNEWYDRAERRRMSCTADPNQRNLAYGGRPERIGHSARRLRVPTLADRLRAVSPESRVIVLSMKPRSAVMLAGHGGTAVTWFADTNTWSTSTAFSPRLLPEVQTFLDAHPIERERATVWDRARDERLYQGSDESPFERARAGWSSAFPHPLAGAPGTPPERFYDLWERSPFSDEYLGRLAAHLIEAYQLGRRDAVDFLAISFSALDYVGHDFGPDSHEVQDTLLRLDRTIGELLAVLDSTVGAGRYAVGLSSDHGVSRIPEAAREDGISAGRVLSSQVRRVAEEAMQRVHGMGPHVAHVEYTNIYLTDAARARAARDPSYLDPLVTAVEAIPGVDRVLPARVLDMARDSQDPIERAAALGHHPDESGDAIVVLEPNWVGTDSSAASHGSSQPYDAHVPVIFYGRAFRAGRYMTPASPADLAPTLASLVALEMAGTDGMVRSEALHP